MEMSARSIYSIFNSQSSLKPSRTDSEMPNQHNLELYHLSKSSRASRVIGSTMIVSGGPYGARTLLPLLPFSFTTSPHSDRSS